MSLLDSFCSFCYAVYYTVKLWHLTLIELSELTVSSQPDSVAATWHLLTTICIGFLLCCRFVLFQLFSVVAVLCSVIFSIAVLGLSLYFTIFCIFLRIKMVKKCQNRSLNNLNTGVCALHFLRVIMMSFDWSLWLVCSDWLTGWHNVYRTLYWCYVGIWSRYGVCVDASGVVLHDFTWVEFFCGLLSPGYLLGYCYYHIFSQYPLNLW